MSRKINPSKKDEKTEFQNVKICSQCSNLSTKPIFCLSLNHKQELGPLLHFRYPSSWRVHTHTHDLPLTKFTRSLSLCRILNTNTHVNVR
jgi:hypothetical protein